MSNSKLLNHFIDFVETVSNKPGMFLINNIEDIGLVVFGYTNGCSYNSKEDYYCIEDFMSNFKKYVNNHYATTEEYDWVRLIRFNCVGDAATLDFFKYIFDNFIKESR